MAQDRVLDALMDVVRATRQNPNDPVTDRAAKRFILDSLGTAFGGFYEDTPTAVRHLMRSAPVGEGGCSVIGDTVKVVPAMAAFANSAMVRYLDLNDSYGSTVGVGHPSDYIAAALATAERVGASGARLLAAVNLSYEVFCRLTDATKIGVDKWDHVINGAVAAAASSAYLLGLSDEQTRHALSLALTPNLALQVTRLGTLSMWKGCAAGNACRNGIFAADVAAAGISGPEAPFEGRGGLLEAIGQEPDLELMRREGMRPAILDCHIKRYPSGYFSQGAVEAAENVRAELATAGEIERVVVGTFEFGSRVMAGDREKWHPTTRETADHSIPYAVATALVNGTLHRSDFDEESLRRPEVLFLLDHLEVVVDPECQSAWPEACMNKVTVWDKDGREHTSTVRYYRGHALNPLSDEEVEAKYADQADPVIGTARAKELAQLVWSLEQLSDVSDLFRATVPDAGR
ncbi:MAG: MmgE/PrpD family protein [Nitrospiraceae bacterium]|nr:MmgE/PrpD family protein [Nitrospiraceae bacterium]MDA8207618.1 MmgE/PrpD family protein [Actinomycetota bacterium]